MKRHITHLVIVVCLFSCRHWVENSGLVEINNQNNLNLKVESFSNDRGYGIINDKYWLPSNSKVKGNTEQIKNLISKNYFYEDYIRPIPRIYDLKLPYTLLKTSEGKQIMVIKEKDTIEFELTN